MAHYVKGSQPGAVIVGSHVKKSSEQLDQLLQQPGTVGIEVEVKRLLHDPLDLLKTGQQQQELLRQTLEQIHSLYTSGKTPVIYTSRQELTFSDRETRLAFGQAVSALLMDILRGLPTEIGFLISKGGITSNDTLSVGLAIPAVRLLGQISAGVSVVMTPSDHPQFPDLPVVLFPGNVGNTDTLAVIYRRLRGKGSDLSG
jgi:uncharacterized protein YgbK (DUF1537 family)